MQTLFLDFETFYDPANGYNLGKGGVSVTEYIRSPLFKAHGAGFRIDDGELHWATTRPNTQWYFLEGVLDKIDWANITLVGHNLKFDGAILKWIYGVEPALYVDTKCLAKALLGKTVRTCSLGDVAGHFSLQPKGMMKTAGIRDLELFEEHELAKYCLHDVELTREIYNRLWPQFPKDQVKIMDWTIRSFINPRLTLDVPLLEQCAASEKERKSKIFDLIGIEKKVFSSNVKFPKLLESEGFDVPMKKSPRSVGEDGKPVMIPVLAVGDPEFLEMAESPNERLRTLCEARIAAKSTLLETRSEKLAAIGKTGAWPFDVEFSGAMQTHRFSGGGNAGGNPQNFTKDSALRASVCAPKGYKFICADFSQIEARLVAYLSKDPGLIRVIENEPDLYCDFGSSHFGRRITRADKAERDFSKVAILGLGYGMGVERFKKAVLLETGQKISPDDAKKAVTLYRTKYSRVPAFWSELEAYRPTMAGAGRVGKDGVTFGAGGIELPSGLKIRYPNLRVSGELHRGKQQWVYDVWKKRSELESVKLYGGKILENICQALAGELCKDAMRPFLDKVVGQVHDEIHLLAPNAEAEDVAEALYEAMVTPPRWLPKLKLEAEIKIGDTWAGAK